MSYLVSNDISRLTDNDKIGLSFLETEASDEGIRPKMFSSVN